MPRKLSVLLLLIVVYLQYCLWLGKNNLFDFLRVKKTLTEMRIENDKLKLRNDRLFTETADLYAGLEAIEERARVSLGMVKSDEHFYRLIIKAERE